MYCPRHHGTGDRAPADVRVAVDDDVGIGTKTVKGYGLARCEEQVLMAVKSSLSPRAWVAVDDIARDEAHRGEARGIPSVAEGAEDGPAVETVELQGRDDDLGDRDRSVEGAWLSIHQNGRSRL